MTYRKTAYRKQFQDTFSQYYPELLSQAMINKEKNNDGRAAGLVKTITFVVTEGCTLNCSYCYQVDKDHSAIMSKETAMKAVDMILDDSRMEGYINSIETPGIVIDFIGGEPLLQIELIDFICDYFRYKTVMLNHPWAYNHMFNFTSNGTLYFTEPVQRFLKKNRGRLSFTITIDGNEELHDSCRVFPNGEGSYSIVERAVKHAQLNHGLDTSKITIAPENVIYLADAIKHLSSLGIKDLNANVVYENVWVPERDTYLFYDQLINLADWFIEEEKYIESSLSLFEETIGREMPDTDNQNWCWGKGTPILTDKGYVPIEEIKVGDMVYTANGRLRAVTNTMNHFDENVVQIKASGLFPLTCTSNHNLFVKPFDYIGNKNIKHFKEIQKIEVQNIKHNDLLFLSSNLEERNINIDKTIAYLVGRFIGDGYTTTQGGKNIVCALEEKDELEQYLINANLEYSCILNKKVYEFHIFKRSEKENNKLFNDLTSTCGKLAHNKKLPLLFTKWNNDSLTSLLDGYIAADGHLKPNDMYAINTVSYILAQELMVLLRLLKYTPSCYKYNREGKSIILGREVNIKDRYEIYFYKNPERSRYIKYKDNAMTTYGMDFIKVEPQTVYNITVDEDHSYIAGGLLSANCGGNGQMLSIGTDGRLFPCIRFMKYSLNDKTLPEFEIGTVEKGIDKEQDNHFLTELSQITRLSQSEDKCKTCKVASGCAWCTGYNYDVFKTPNKRATFICELHKARVLANYYFWNKLAAKLEIPLEFDLNLNEEEINFITKGDTRWKNF